MAGHVRRRERRDQDLPFARRVIVGARGGHLQHGASPSPKRVGLRGGGHDEPSLRHAALAGDALPCARRAVRRAASRARHARRGARSRAVDGRRNRASARRDPRHVREAGDSTPRHEEQERAGDAQRRVLHRRPRAGGGGRGRRPVSRRGGEGRGGAGRGGRGEEGDLGLAVVGGDVDR